MPGKALIAPDTSEVDTFSQQVAGAEPQVAFLEHVAKNLRLGLGGRGVALEAVSRPIGIVDDPADHFTRFVRRTAFAETGGVADRLLALDVVADDRYR